MLAICRALLFGCALTVDTTLWATEEPRDLPPIGEFPWSSTYWNLAIGGEFISNVNKRGATLYDGHQMFPIFALHLFSKNLLIVGSSLHLRERLAHRLLFRSIATFNATPDDPLLETAGAVDDRDLREPTIELDQVLELEFLWGEAQLSWSKDVRAHFGSYGQLKIRQAVARLPAGKLRLEPALFASVGGGSDRHNSYLYGEGAKEGLGTYSVGLSLSAPPAIDHYFPVFEIYHYGLLSERVKNGARIDGKTAGWSVLALFALSVL